MSLLLFQFFENKYCYGWALEALLLTKTFIKSKFSYLPFFLNSSAKVKWGGLLRHRRLLIANHLDESLQKANQKHEQQSDHIYYTLLCQVLCFAACTSLLSKSCKNAKPKPFLWAKPAWFDLSSSNFNLQGHILSKWWVFFYYIWIWGWCWVLHHKPKRRKLVESWPICWQVFQLFGSTLSEMAINWRGVPPLNKKLNK
jgi:hypothetical protein